MGSIVKVSRDLIGRMRGFCNIFASMCDRCYHYPCSCSLSDEIQLAKSLIVEIDNLRDMQEERFYIDNPFERRLENVVNAIRQGGGKNVSSSDIHIPEEDRKSKARLLRRLVLRNRIVKVRSNGRYLYSITDDGLNTNNTNSKGEADYGIRHEQHQHEGGAQAADDARRG